MTAQSILSNCSQSSFKGTLGTYINAKDLFAINNNIQSGEYGIAYEKEVTFLKNFLSEIRLSHNFDRLIEECKELGSILLEAHTIFKDYMIWVAEEKKHFREYLFNNELLKEEEKTDDFLNKFSYEWVDAAKKSVQVLTVNNINYYVPVSSNKSKYLSSFLIYDGNKRLENVTSSLRFSFMFPCPIECISLKDINLEVDKKYKILTQKEYEFCNKYIEQIKKTVMLVKDPNGVEIEVIQN